MHGDKKRVTFRTNFTVMYHHRSTSKKWCVWRLYIRSGPISRIVVCGTPRKYRRYFCQQNDIRFVQTRLRSKSNVASRSNRVGKKPPKSWWIFKRGWLTSVVVEESLNRAQHAHRHCCAGVMFTYVDKAWYYLYRLAWGTRETTKIK